MLKKIFVAFVIVFLVGCASTKTVRIDQESSITMQEKSMALSASDKPDFAAMTAGKAMFAMVGAFAMISAGNEIVQKHDVEDTAKFITQEVAKNIGSTLSVNIKEPVIYGNNDDIAHLIAVHRHHDYILDIRTVNWSFGYFPTDWDSYRVMYSAKLKLIDVKASEIVAEAFCSRVPEQTSESPSYDQLLENNAARLKDELRISADHCIKELSRKI